MSNKHEFSGSESIAHCDYDDEAKCMKIKFHSGKTYEYQCDKSVYEALKVAKSAGAHFHQNIRPRYKGKVC